MPLKRPKYEVGVWSCCQLHQHTSQKTTEPCDGS
nr:MAG TPA: hypothetical protein [Bacteriophage sp.]